MYICICNGLTDKQVCAAAQAGACRLAELYRACGCTAQCGRCAQAMLKMIPSIANDESILSLEAGD
nr:(2Fe-2S)-binding protein [Granulibacter bethesdensis]